MSRNLTAVILIILAAGVYFTVTRSVVADATAIKNVNDKYSLAITNALTAQNLLDELKVKYNKISEQDRTGLDKMIPTAVDNIRLIIDLNNLAYRHRIVLTGVKASVPSNSQQNASFPMAKDSLIPGNLPTNNSGPSAGIGANQSWSEPALDKVLVTFGFSAGYTEGLQFLEDMEANLRIMDLTHLNITANDSGTFNFDTQFQTYWLRQ